MSAHIARPGRRYDRKYALCHGCGARLTLGDPASNQLWPANLELTLEQRDRLLSAAAEYEELSEEAGTISNAVEFVDWISPSVLGPKVREEDRIALERRRERDRERKAEAAELARLERSA